MAEILIPRPAATVLTIRLSLIHIYTSTLSPWVGLGVFTLYAAAALAGGLLLVARRDV